MNDYLISLQRGNFDPNFYISEEYFEKAELLIDRYNGCIFVHDEDWVVFPPILEDGGLPSEETLKFILKDFKGIWSDFSGYFLNDFFFKFLDYEYIYNPENFLSMKGGKWEVFRKNCRKFPKRVKDKLIYQFFDFEEDELILLLKDWLEKKPPDEEIRDDELMLKYLFRGKNRKFLVGESGKIYGVNIWDYNWKFINYRFSFCKRENFLTEYMRWLFYTDSDILVQKKLVNDGGVLGSESLKFFKDKLNPIFVRKVFSWLKIMEGV